MTDSSPTTPETDSPIQPDSMPQDSVAEDSTPELTAAEAAAEANPMVNPSRSIRLHGPEESRKLAAAAVRVALDNNGYDLAVIDVCSQSAEFDLFVLATGTSRRQLHAISEQIDDALEKGLGDTRMGIEGYEESRWIVLDYGSVVIHLFDQDTRDYYDLESLWADGTPVPLADLGITDAQ